MSNKREEEETRAEYIERMGEQVGDVYHCLRKELIWLHSIWNEYVTLYGTSRIELLNKSAPYFFHVVQKTLLEAIVLNIARLTDKSRIAGKANLSVNQLLELVEDSKLRSELERLINSAKEALGFIRHWRDQHIAHRDLDLALKGDKAAVPLEHRSLEKIQKALISLKDILDAVTLHYFNSTTNFDMGANRGGAELLLNILHDDVVKK